MRICIHCNSNKAVKNKLSCQSCRKKPWQKYKKEYCEGCGFIPIWMGQLDVDHIDSDKQNNNPENLQTLCANCHRLKTHLNKDYNQKEGSN